MAPVWCVAKIRESVPIILWMEEILHQYLQGFIHPRWCRISAVNSTISKHSLMLFLKVHSLSGSIPPSFNLVDCFFPAFRLENDLSRNLE